MLNDVAKTTIERYEDAALASGDREDSMIGNTNQLFVTSECHVVAGLPENRSHGIGYILIELDRGHAYAAGTGTIVSRASSAA